jgi:hypothetical protein
MADLLWPFTERVVGGLKHGHAGPAFLALALCDRYRPASTPAGTHEDLRYRGLLLFLRCFETLAP